jgi:hypothetical protein
MSLFGNLFGGGYQNAASTQQQYALAGMMGASNYLNQATGDIQTGAQQAQQPWSQIAPQALGGYNAYADITGAQGQAGQQRAQALFQTDPGYQFAMNQALQATQRAQGTGGFQGSGNVLTALQDRASGLAQQQYGNYVARLAPYLQVAPQVAGAQAGISQWQGGNLANIAGAQGNLYSNTANAIGQSQAAADIAQQNAQNQFLGGVLGLGTKLLGYGGSSGGGGGGYYQGNVNPFGNYQVPTFGTSG